MANTCPKCNTKNPDTLKFCGECGTQLPSIEDIDVTETMEAPKEELTTGSTFAGRYQIIEELGKGGMGRVYKVLDKEVNAKVALKLIKPEIAADKKTIERFRNELKIARDIAHKNVCRMYHLGKEEGAYYITMEYVSGEDLKSFIRRSGLISTGKAISIANQVCEGLLEAHRLGIIHRDLKPQNIMIDREGNARIMDFGIARSLRAKGITGSGVMIGTPEYMSPEQVDGKEADQRADIYSLGVILYEMVTGRVPFEGDTPFSIGVKQKSEIPRPPKEINEQIPEDLNRVILKCMEKEKDNRYQSVCELHSELMSLEKGDPTTERIIPERKPLTSREITVQFSVKKIFLPALVIIAVVILGFIIWQVLPNKKTPPLAPSGKPSLAVMYFENSTGDENFDHWRTALSEWLITDFSQSKYVDVLSGDRLLNILKRLDLLEVKKYDSADLRAVSSEAGVNHILKASLSKPGNIFRVDYTLYEMKTGDSVGSDFVMGEGEESFPSMVDDLTKKIKSNFKLSFEEIASDNDKEVGKITTSYPEAYKYYNRGREYHLSLDYRQSISFMERAIEIDPEFAMAYRSLGSAHINMGNRTEAIKNLTKSFELSDRTSDKEKYWIIGDYYRNVEGDYDKAIEAYNKLFELDPDNEVAHNNIAMIYATFNDWDNAIKHLEVNRKNKAEFIGSYTNLGNYYEAKGMYQEAREAFQDSINNFSDTAFIHVYIARSYAFEGKYELALEEVDKALELDPTLPNPKGQIYHLQGDFDAAEKEYKGYLEKDAVPWKMNGYRWLEHLYRMLGQYDKAKKEAQAGLKYAEEIDNSNWKRRFYNLLAGSDLNDGNWEGVLEKAEFIWDSAVKDESPGWQSTALWLKIQGHLQQDNIEKTVAIAGEAKKILDNTPSAKDICDHFDNLGLIEMKKGNYPKAIDLFTQACELQAAQWSFTDPHAYFLFSLASAYNLNGDMEMAKKKFEDILALTTGKLADGDLYVKSFYMLGKIHEQQGNTAKAIENYEKFLDLWKDADPGIAEVEDARERLAGLKGNLGGGVVEKKP